MINKIEEACLEDGVEMLEIIESESSKGNIELIYTRRTNAFESYKKENKNSKIAIIRDKKGKIVFQAACVPGSYHVDGKSVLAGYVGGIRKRNDYNGVINWKDVADFFEKQDLGLYLCSFLSGNEASEKMFLKKRDFMPKLVSLCNYTTYIINPKIFTKVCPEGLTFRSIKSDDLEYVHEFLKREMMKYNFSTAINNITDFYGLNIDDCYVLEKRGEILAFGALWNQKGFKQYIVKGYSKTLKTIQKFSFATNLLGYIDIPEEGKELDFPMLSFFYSKEGNMEYYNLFINQIAQSMRKKYKMFVIGICDDDPADKLYKKIRTINFKSKIYCADFKDEFIFDPARPRRIECGLL
ncbi:MAG: hypothetical protein AAGU39_13275 [Sedimentibacter saalensis]|uniref:hypothetical protein n=1 Tax=Sedimentibacter saalensis TaxID=130788 RepID=UPI0031589734